MDTCFIISRRNANLIMQHTTAYPFRLPSNLMTCIECLTSFDEPEDFREHMAVNHIKVLRQTLFRIDARYDIKADITDLKCKICTQPFENLDAVATHLQSTHNIDIDLKQKLGLQPFKIYRDRYSCFFCSQKCNDMRTLSRHTQTHSVNYSCNICGKPYVTEASIKAHIKLAHGERKVYCVKCRTGFDSSEDKKAHILANETCWPYVCNFCGVRCYSKVTKRSHMVADHDYKPPQYTCPECPTLVLPNKDVQKSHFIRVHTNKFKCDHCDKKFGNNKKLIDHMLSHGPDALFQCEVCYKQFARLPNLRSHMFNHQEKKRYECKPCNKQFNQRVSWRAHMASCHPEQTT